MIYKTHHIAGVIAAELVLLHHHQPPLSWQTAAALVGAYFAGPAADVDQPQSYIGQKVWPLSLLLQGLGIRHRTMTHSLLFMAGLWAVLVALPIPEVVVWAVMAAYVSHPFIDLFNEEGVELLWPLRMRFRLLPAFLSVRVDSLTETALRSAMTVVSFFLLFVYLRPVVASVPVIGGLADHITGELLIFFREGL